MAGRSYKKLMESLKTTRKPLDLKYINTLFLEDHEGMDPLEEDQLDEELMMEEVKRKKLFQMSSSPVLPLSIWPPQMQTMHTPCPPNAAVHIVATHQIAGHQTGVFSSHLRGDVDLSSDLRDDLDLSSDLRGDLDLSSDLRGDLDLSSDLRGDLDLSSDLRGDLDLSSDLRGDLYLSSDLRGDLGVSDLPDLSSDLQDDLDLSDLSDDFGLADLYGKLGGVFELDWHI
ncbi:UNVERIFIED_CONTAM: hypothetical protein FKN15_029371 [Acipenser sinensis]